MYYFIFRLGQTPLHGIYNLQSSLREIEIDEYLDQ